MCVLFVLQQDCVHGIHSWMCRDNKCLETRVITATFFPFIVKLLYKISNIVDVWFVGVRVGLVFELWLVRLSTLNHRSYSLDLR